MFKIQQFQNGPTLRYPYLWNWTI